MYVLDSVLYGLFGLRFSSILQTHKEINPLVDLKIENEWIWRDMVLFKQQWYCKLYFYDFFAYIKAVSHFTDKMLV